MGMDAPFMQRYSRMAPAGAKAPSAIQTIMRLTLDVNERNRACHPPPCEVKWFSTVAAPQLFSALIASHGKHPLGDWADKGAFAFADFFQGCLF